MIKVEDIEIGLLATAIHGSRNPMESWNKSDSKWLSYTIIQDEIQVSFDEPIRILYPDFFIGSNDIKLVNTLHDAGSEHRKCVRQAFIGMDVTAPLYWWKEFDQYKIGVTTDSCSTMHKIHSKPIELTDFSFEDFYIDDNGLNVEDYFINVVADCEELRQLFLKTKDKKYWRALIQLLPESYNQRRTITMSYENLINMLNQRRNHKLIEWNNYCEVLEKIPYVKEIRGE